MWCVRGSIRFLRARLRRPWSDTLLRAARTWQRRGGSQFATRKPPRRWKDQREERKEKGDESREKRDERMKIITYMRKERKKREEKREERLLKCR